MSAEDHFEIANLVYRYPELIDAGDFDGIAELFRHATLRAGNNVVRGRNELVPMLKRLVRIYEGGRPFTKHLVSNLVIEVAPDRATATARSYVTVLQARPSEFPLQVIASNRHFDRFECVDGAWRFSERVDIPDLAGDLSRHVTETY